MATITKQPMAAVSISHGKAMPVRTFLEAAAQTFKKGAPLVINAGGQVAEIGADPSKIDAIALSDATGVTDTEIQGVLPLPAVIFQANISGSGTNDQTDVGDLRGIIKDGDNFHVDESESGDPVLEIVGLRGDAGDTNGIVYFRFLSSISVPKVDASTIANVADANVEGGVPVIFRILTAGGASANIDVVMKHKVRVIDAWAILKAAPTASDTVVIQNVTTDITDVIVVTANDEDLVRAISIDDAQHEIAAAANLRVAQVDGGGSDSPALEVYVLAIRVA